MENASLLEASRRSWKEGGAISQERYKGTQSAESGSRVEVLVVFVLFCGEAVREATRSLELAVSGESGRREGDADWRRSSASGVARTCAFV